MNGWITLGNVLIEIEEEEVRALAQKLRKRGLNPLRFVLSILM